MTEQTLHEKLVDAIINGERGDIVAMIERVAEAFPEATDDDIADAMVEAAEQLEERAESNQRELATMQLVAQLFEGMPEGMELGECARIKAERGDPLALAFLEWEKKQAGGVQ